MAIACVALPARGKVPPKKLSRVAESMRRDGAVRLSGLFPIPLLRRLRARVLRRHESGELRERGLVRDVAGRYAAVLPFEGPFLDRAFYANPALLDVMGVLLGETMCLGSLEAVIALPGAYEQHVHVDGPLRLDRAIGGRKRLYPRDVSDLPAYAVTLCVPLCDMTERNGPTAIWPGSHRAARGGRLPTEAAVRRRFPMELMTGPLGDCFLFDYRVFHCGMPNDTRQARPALMLVFTRSWFRDPNLLETRPGVVIAPRDLARVPQSRRGLFLLAPAARRALWKGRAGGA